MCFTESFLFIAEELRHRLVHTLISGNFLVFYIQNSFAAARFTQSLPSLVIKLTVAAAAALYVAKGGKSPLILPSSCSYSYISISLLSSLSCISAAVSLASRRAKENHRYKMRC